MSDTPPTRLEYAKDAKPEDLAELLADPPADTQNTADIKAEAPDELDGDTVGPYRLLERLGEGGMGIVYKAKQQTPIQRIVALKLIKAGFGTREVIARFEAERQALARMDHPNIAKVFDAGINSRGHPYFVMEYIPGVGMIRFCDDNRFNVTQRLQLFIQICEAVAHAHAKSIIHRDIKASNVMAYFADGKPFVKVIDFGIAKAVAGEQLSEHTYWTAHGHAVGTYDSMSPEQAEGSPDVDTRSDIYSLGTLLYELLAGAKPFDPRDLAQAAHLEMRRIIREVDPPLPSQRLGALDMNTGTSIARARGTERDPLMRDLRSELDWIPMMAMRKDRTRRYATPLEMAADIRNYLDNRPLLARPDSVAYRLRKSARRNRVAIGIVGGMILFITLATIVHIHGLRSANDRTEAARQIAVNQRDLADERAYLASLAASDLAFEHKDIGSARRWLQLAPEALRGWEWRFADARTEPSLLTIHFEGRPGSLCSQTWRAVTVRDGRFLTLWDLQTGQMLCTRDLGIPKNVVRTFDRAGRRLLITNGGAGTILDADTLRTEVALKLPGARVTAVEFSPNRQLVAASTSDKLIYLLNADTGEVVGTLEDPGESFRTLTFSPDGSRLLCMSGDGSINTWDISSRQLLTTRHDDSLHPRLPDPAGEQVIVANERSGLEIRNWATDALVTTLQHPISRCRACFSSASNSVALAEADGTINIFDISTGERRVQLLGNESNGQSLIAFNADGTLLAAASMDQTIRVWDNRPQLTGLFCMGHRGFVWDLCFSPDGSRLVSVGEDGLFKVWDVESASQIAQVQNESSLHAVAWIADGNTIITGDAAGKLQRLDAHSFKRLSSISEHSDCITSVNVAPDSFRVLVGSWDKTAKIVDAQDGATLIAFPPHDNRIQQAVFSPDGQRVATASWDNTARILDASTGRLIFTLIGHPDQVYGVAFSPDGSLLATASADTARIWDTRTGSLLKTLAGHSGGVTSVVFNHDGSRVVTTGTDQTVRIWNPRNGALYLTLRGPGTVVVKACFSPDDTRLAAACYDGSVWLWDTLPVAERMKRASHR